MKPRIALLLVLLGVVGGLLGYRAFADPEAREMRRITKRVLALAESVSFGEKDSPFQRLGYADRVAGFFGPTVELAINLGTREAHATLSRSELKERAGVMRATARGLSVRFLDVVPSLDIQGPRDRASVHLTSKIYFLGDVDYIVQEFRLRLVKHAQNGWEVVRVETVRTME
ncbi:MAG: hypothetical protein JNL97_09050 [Verrucomicrobiales bacterium]|nr:hypothetical protein [Verrucomicrobiales bacterium]